MHVTTHTKLVLVFLRGAAYVEHSHYLGKRKRFPLKPPKTLGGFNSLFSELRGEIPKPSWPERSRQGWIFPETWHLIDTKIVAYWSQDVEHR